MLTLFSTKRQKGDSPLKIAFRRLRRHRIAMIGLVVLVILYCSAIFASWVAPYPFDETFRQNANQPPTRIHFIDSKGNLHFRPFVYHYAFQLDRETFERKYIPDITHSYPIQFFMYRTEFLEGNKTHRALHLFGVQEPALLFLFGSDASGRDVFSRIIYGGRISLSIGLLGILISFSLGMIIGGISGYIGGLTDYCIMRSTEIVMMIPSLFLMLTLRAAFLGFNLNSIQVYLMIIIILSFISWASLARIIRGIVLSLREEEYVLAARILGASTPRIIIGHILPNTLSFAIISATLSIPGYILGESALSLLGLGIVEPQTSWGNMLSAAKNVAVIEEHPWILIPGLFIFVSILAFNFLGDGLRDAFDPKS